MESTRPIRDSSSTRFDAVLFDFGGTLDADGVPSVEQFFRAYRDAGGRTTREHFDVLFRESDRALAADPATRTRGFRDTVCEQSRLLIAFDGDAHLDAAAMAVSVHAAAKAAAERNALSLRALRDRGLRLGVLSNFTGNLDRCLAELGLASLFDVAIDSAIAGVRKPEAAIFHLALAQLGVDARRALMVGDNPFADIRAAARLGMSTCWLAPSGRSVPAGCVPTYRIERLADVLHLIDASSAGAVAAPCTG
jgi:putative hydrolase of the HAD superfamily